MHFVLSIHDATARLWELLGANLLTNFLVMALTKWLPAAKKPFFFNPLCVWWRSALSAEKNAHKHMKHNVMSISFTHHHVRIKKLSLFISSFQWEGCCCLTWIRCSNCGVVFDKATNIMSNIHLIFYSNLLKDEQACYTSSWKYRYFIPLGFTLGSQTALQIGVLNLF